VTRNGVFNDTKLTAHDFRDLYRDHEIFMHQSVRLTFIGKVPLGI